MAASKGEQEMNPEYEAHERLCKSIGDMAKENEALKQHVKRLEEAGDLMVQHFYTDEPRSEMWEKAKEAKL
jgi:hypothetical protein